MTDLSGYDDAALDALRVEVLTEQSRRRVAAEAPGRVAEMVTAIASANSANAPIPATSVTGDRFIPGQKYTEGGKEFRLKSGIPPLPKTVLPSTDTAGLWWEQTNLPPASTYPAWSASAIYKVGDRVTRNGRVWQCLVAHGAEYQGTWGPPSTGVWKDLGPA